jgi:DNA polymerase elongation subunit (family B)
VAKEIKELSDKELLSLKKQLEYDISKYHNFQLVRKIQLNSAYGAIGNEWFRYYSTELAEAITLSGQLSIQWIGQELNKYLNKVIKTDGVDYVIASDTDSVYLCLDGLVQRVFPNKGMFDGKPVSPDTKTIVDFLDKSSQELILPFIDKKFKELSDIMNAYENKMQMGREIIANKGIWTAKKRYMLNVWDSEGVRYTEPKLKIMGIETTRSSTPKIVREELENVIDIILNENEDSLISYIQDFKTRFMKMPVESIAFPRSVNGMDKYADPYQIYKKSTPIAVKGALIYNHHISNMGLDKKYRLVGEGEKIKYLHLKKPNPLGGMKGEDQIIAFPSTLPKEFKLDGYVDYNAHFEKSFIDPLSTIVNAIGWQLERKTTLESLFE